MAVYSNLYGQRAALNAGDPLAQGLIGWWPLNEAGGTTSFDATGNGTMGIATGTPTHAPAPLGHSFKFDGSTQYLTYTVNAILNPGEQSITAWIKATAFTNSYNALVNRIAAGNAFYQQLFVKSDGKLAIYISHGPFYDGSGTHTLVADRWYFIAWTFRDSNLIGYVNAEFDGSNTGGNPTLDAFAGQLTIAQDLGSGGRLFAGQIADVRVYNRALTPSDLLLLYREPSRPLRVPRSPLPSMPTAAAAYRARVVRWG